MNDDQGDRNEQASRERSKRGAVGRGTDQDLSLKVAMRRLLWRMGCSSRLDVRLRGYVAGPNRGPGWQEYTDLDVLGIGFTPAGQLHTTFADCRSTARAPIERMFWIRGVADFVDADDAYMVRAQPVPSATRTLSSRLGVGVLAPDDLAALDRTFPTELNLHDGPLSCLFNRDATAAHLNAYDNADRKLGKVLDYLNFDYWVYEPYRNLTQLIGHLSGVVKTLDPTNRQHRALFYDCAWHYTLAIAHAVAYARATRMGEIPTAIETYVAGGELALREKGNLARLLKRSGFPDIDDSIIQPPYIKLTVELITRFLVRPAEIVEVLRYAEYLAVSEVNRIGDTVGEALGKHVRPVAAKLLADVCGYLVTAAGLRPDFRAAARTRLVVDLTGGDPASPAENMQGSAKSDAEDLESDAEPTETQMKLGDKEQEIS